LWGKAFWTAASSRKLESQWNVRAQNVLEKNAGQKYAQTLEKNDRAKICSRKVQARNVLDKFQAKQCAHNRS
jgi:hypothetical protein